MVDRKILRELLDKEPFQIFRIHMNDGHSYEVDHPQVVVPMDSMVFIALPGDRFKFLSYLNITRLESSEIAA
jgi:hypothetical protein